MVTDSVFAPVAEFVANHVVVVKMQHYPFAERAAAQAWLRVSCERLRKRGRVTSVALAAYRSAIVISASRTMGFGDAAAISRNSSTTSRSSDCVSRVMADRYAAACTVAMN